MAATGRNEKHKFYRYQFIAPKHQKESRHKFVADLVGLQS
jgi:hypothetical protein